MLFDEDAGRSRISVSSEESLNRGWYVRVIPVINKVYIHKTGLGQLVGLGGGASVGLAPLGGSMGGQVEANQPKSH